VVPARSGRVMLGAAFCASSALRSQVIGLVATRSETLRGRREPGAGRCVASRTLWGGSPPPARPLIPRGSPWLPADHRSRILR
jgi:hypothetical protein